MTLRGAPISERRLLVGVDVGGSKIAVLVAGADGGVVRQETIAGGIGPADDPVERIAAAVSDTLARDGLTPGEVAAIGLGVPGRVDPVAGTVSLAVNLGWRDLPLGARLAERFGVPVRLENDVRAAAAELHDRAVAGDGSDFAYLSVGTGISAGVILGGRLHRGRRGMAGEIGHVVVDERGPDCRCGLRGCLEAIASGPAVARRAAAAAATAGDSILHGRIPLAAPDVFAAAAAGDRVAREVVDSAGRGLARAVHLLVTAYDVPRVVVGGGVSAAGRPLLDPIVAALDELRARSALARDALPPDVVRLLPSGTDAGVRGALALARRALGQAPPAAAGVRPGRRWSHENA